MQFGEPEFDNAAAALRAEAERAVEIRAQLAEIVGEASNDTETVRAVVGPTGLQELVLDPRVMRMPSADLAATVVEVTRLARDNFNDRRAATAAELGASARPSLEESLASLDRLNSMVRSGSGDAQAVYERFRDEMRGDR